MLYALPAFKVDARIYQHIGDVADQLERQAHQGKYKQRTENDWIIPVESGLEAQEPKTIQGEDNLNQQRPCEEQGDQNSWQAGNNDQHGVPEHVPVENLVLVKAFGSGRHNIMLTDLIEK